MKLVCGIVILPQVERSESRIETVVTFAEASQCGFGSTLIERTLSHEMDAVVRQEFRPAGLYCAIDIPLTEDVGRVQTFSG
jgi:two-component sensor histidine kinase